MRGGRSKTAFDVSDLKFGDVVVRARLSKSTAQYVLKSGLLIPRTGEKGRHHVFAVDQAVQLALATRLVMSGIPVATAVAIVNFCDCRLSRFRGPVALKRGPRFSAERSKPWKLEVLDDELVRLFRRGLEEMWNDSEAYYSVTKRELVEAEEFPDPIARHEINLTLLEHELGRER